MLKTATSILSMYVSFILSFFTSLAKPIEDFVRQYSTSLGFTISILTKIIAYNVVLLPLYIVSIIIASLLTDVPNISMLINENLYLIFSEYIVMLLLFMSVYYPLYFYQENSTLQSIKLLYVEVLLITGSVLLYYAKPPESYVILFAIIYGFGAYYSTDIEIKIKVPHGYVDEKIQNEKKIKYISLLGFFTVLSLFIANIYADIPQHIVGATSISVGVITTKLINDQIRSVYEYIDFSIPSSVWLLTPRILILLSIFTMLHYNDVSVISISVILLSTVIGLIFAYYTKYIKVDVFGNIKYKNTNTEFKDIPKYLTKYYINTDITTDKNENITFESSFQFPDDFPKDDPRLWKDMLKYLYHINKIIQLQDKNQNNKNPHEEDINAIQDLQEKAVREYVKHANVDDYKTLIENSDKTIKKYIIAYCVDENIFTLQDIQEITKSENIKQKVSVEEYAEKPD